LTGTFLCARAVFPTMEGQKSGVIINVSSGKGKRGSAGYGVYSAAKAAVNNLTETLAEEGAPFNIRVNTMGPGGHVATRLGLEHDLIDSKEMLTVDVVVPLAVYLACDDSSGITGKNFNALLWNEEKGLGSPGRYIYRGTTDKK
ncbi:MAG: SDR family oxidoreductase, partial [Dehalococcoidia bacterium]|nr:SDR family oxidoreductase [Dehalococcoidia bacterium]